MILAPKYDLTDWELTQLMASPGRGRLFRDFPVFRSLNLTNFQALFRAFGIDPYPGMVIAKEEDKESYYSDSP
jgi:hypothetical protein